MSQLLGSWRAGLPQEHLKMFAGSRPCRKLAVSRRLAVFRRLAVCIGDWRQCRLLQGCDGDEVQIYYVPCVIKMTLIIIPSLLFK